MADTLNVSIAPKFDDGQSLNRGVQSENRLDAQRCGLRSASGQTKTVEHASVLSIPSRRVVMCAWSDDCDICMAVRRISFWDPSKTGRTFPP